MIQHNWLILKPVDLKYLENSSVFAVCITQVKDKSFENYIWLRISYLVKYIRCDILIWSSTLGVIFTCEQSKVRN